MGGSSTLDRAERVPAALVSARDRARAERDDAQREARALLESARAAADGLVAEARAEAARSLAAAAGELDRARRASAELRSDELVELALAVAGKLLDHVAERDEDYIRARAEDALARLDRAGRVELRCHPDDAAALASAYPACVVTPDDACEPGDLVARSGSLTVDARKATRLAALSGALATGRGT